MPIITTALNYDTFFYNQMLALLESLKINSPQDKIIINLVDFPKRKIIKLEKAYPDYIFKNKDLHVNKMEDIAGFMSCYRSSLMYNLLNEYKCPVAWMDCDIVIRKELSFLWEGVKTNQFKIVYRGIAVPIKNRFQTGVIVIGYSNDTLNMINDWNDKLKITHKWFSDQIFLYEVYQKYIYKIKFIHMNRSLNDVGDSTKECFLDDSIIWHSKRYHFNDKRFQKEFKYYLHKAQGRLDK